MIWHMGSVGIFCFCRSGGDYRGRSAAAIDTCLRNLNCRVLNPLGGDRGADRKRYWRKHVSREVNMFTVKLTSMNRRAFLMGSAAAALAPAALLALNPDAADAKEAMFGNKAPAWYRFKLGDFEATVVSDGTLNLGPAAPHYPKTPKEAVDEL